MRVCNKFEHLVDVESMKKKEKKIGSKFEPNGPKSVPKLGYLPFCQVGSLVFLEIT